MYVLVGTEGPWTPTGLAERTQMPLSTVLFRLRRLERREHAERTPNPDDRRSYLVRLTPAGEALLGEARPRLRALAVAVEAALGGKKSASYAPDWTSCDERSRPNNTKRDEYLAQRLREPTRGRSP